MNPVQKGTTILPQIMTKMECYLVLFFIFKLVAFLIQGLSEYLAHS